MANKKKKGGLRIGGFVIRPAGLAVIAVLLVLIIVLVVLLVKKDDSVTVIDTVTPTPEATETPVPTDTPVPTAVPTATPRPEPRSATIRAIGEIVLTDDVLSAAKSGSSYDFSAMLNDVSDLVSGADYTIATIEGTVGESGSYSGSDSGYRYPASILSELKDLGVDIVCAAGDHMLDNDVNGIANTVSAIGQAGLECFGAGSTTEEALPVIETVNNIKIGFVGYTDSLGSNTKLANKTEQQYMAHYAVRSDAVSDIRNAKIAGANFIIACMSWGDEYATAPTTAQRQYAQTLAEAGANVIIGYNPRSVQPMEWIEGTNSDGTSYKALCLYAPGCLLTGETENGTNAGIVLDFTIQEQTDGSFEVENVHYIPTCVMHTESTGSLAVTAANDDEADEMTAAVEDENTEEETVDEEEADAGDEQDEDTSVEEASDEVTSDEETAEEDTTAERDPDEVTEDEDDEETAEEEETTASSASTGKSTYRVIVCGDWFADNALLNLPEGMTPDDLDVIYKAYAYVQSIVGTSAGTALAK